jgi:hypothetical protein
MARRDTTRPEDDDLVVVPCKACGGDVLVPQWLADCIETWKQTSGITSEQPALCEECGKLAARDEEERRHQLNYTLAKALELIYAGKEVDPATLLHLRLHGFSRRISRAQAFMAEQQAKQTNRKGAKPAPPADPAEGDRRGHNR